MSAIAQSEAAADGTTADLVEQQRGSNVRMRRGWLIRRLLLHADIVGLGLAFLAAATIAGANGTPHRIDSAEFAIFCLGLPAWVVLAKVHGLYDRDEELADHSTVDDLVGVFHVATVGTWLLLLLAWASGVAGWNIGDLALLWLLALALVTSARAVARICWRRSSAYPQNTLIVGSGSVGQLVARKILKHPEYGFRLVGFVDRDILKPRPEAANVPLLGQPDELAQIVRQFDVERVVVAFTDRHDTIDMIRSLNHLDVQVDVVPRLFELFTPTVSVHTIEAFPLVGLPPPRLSPSSRLLKRTLDLVCVSILLVVTAPLFAFVAWRIRRDSPGPVFFRQTRVGQNMHEFTVSKFRTMHVDTDEAEHRRYISETMSSTAAPEANGLYKLDRNDAITRTGRWLRRTSLDELPQLINVLRGEMSLVGPRPCLPYETEHFKPHHFERFNVPPGITGLWQVSARANSTFGEALDMDVAYARGWSLGLDLRLLLRTPVAVLRQRRATA